MDVTALLERSFPGVVEANHDAEPVLDLARGQAEQALPAQSILLQHFLAVGVVAGITLMGFLLTPVVGAHATALVFLLAVVLIALILKRGPALVAATLSALSWDYFFLPPTFAFRISHFEDAMLFAMYFIVALILSQLTARIRGQEETERHRAERATFQYLVAEELSQADNLDQLLVVVVHQLESAFDASVAVLIPDAGAGLRVHSASTLRLSEQDRRLVKVLMDTRQKQGNTTRQFESEGVLYLPVGQLNHPAAVVGLLLRGPLSVHKRKFLQAYMQPITVALECHLLSEVSDRARLLAESERLGKALLDSVSHEIRTPLAAIKSAAATLAELTGFTTPSVQREMVTEIEQATERLNRFVGNVLEMSRLESSNITPRFNECDVSELVHMAVAETERELRYHKLTVHLDADLPLVRMDFVLMLQVLTNLLSNAAAHTPVGTAIDLSANRQGETLVLVVADTGPGIPAESLSRVFNKFYRAPNAPTGGTGLGLALVKGFVEAHEGFVTAENRLGSGACFTVTLPITPANERAHVKTLMPA